MKTPITYYGGKQNIAPIIIERLPFHNIYCEPFFGGGAVFFQKKKPSKLEVINDIDDKLMNFYSVTQHRFDELKLLIDTTLHSESQYLYAKSIWNERIEADAILNAWAIWVITNSSFGGSMHGGWKWSNFSNKSHVGIYLHNKREGFSKSVHNRLKNVQISHKDAIDVIYDRDSIDTFFYLDPPYPGFYQGHYRGYTFKDFSILLNVLQRIKGKFILSNYWSQSLKWYTIKNNWNIERIPTKCKVGNINKKPIEREEILVYNYSLEGRLF